MLHMSEKSDRMPESIAAILGDAAGQADGLGKSGADVYLFDDRWMKGKLPVPEVAAHAVQDGRDWLLMTRMKGKMLCDPSVMTNPALLLDCMAEALHLLWNVPVQECPFERSVEGNLAHAEKTIQAGCFDPSDCEPETFGPGGFKNPEALLDWLKNNRPERDDVLTHGDFCLPNLFTDGKHFTGFIDLGSAGICPGMAQPET